MRKYYYYVYRVDGRFGNGICYSDSGEFELLGMMEILKEQNKADCIITFWREISSSQYEKMRKYFENQNK